MQPLFLQAEMLPHQRLEALDNAQGIRDHAQVLYAGVSVGRVRRIHVKDGKAVLDLDIEGIVLKQGAPTDLPKALAALQKGKKFTPESVSRLLEKISASGYGDKRLSPKESEVLRLFAEGFLVTEIAKKLNRSIKTISSQKKSAMMKLGVDNDIALLNYLSSVTLSATDKD